MTESDHYRPERARHYQFHHRKNVRTRLTTWREQRCLYLALRAAGFPPRVLDMPCGTGRFWPVFARAGVEDLVAGDGSRAMLGVAEGNRQGAHLPSRLLETSAFQTGLPDGCVTFAACLRFYHHLAMADDRQRLLRELRRVSTRYVAISLWVDGNLAARRRMGRTAPAPVAGYGRRICRRRAEVESEFEAAGFRVVEHFDVWPRVSMWRLYLLEHSR